MEISGSLDQDLVASSCFEWRWGFKDVVAGGDGEDFLGVAESWERLSENIHIEIGSNNFPRLAFITQMKMAAEFKSIVDNLPRNISFSRMR